ncbi:MAG TPA: tyrosine-type recombinase/integrase [Dehalococcoidia bacterium]|nr:tyrosine-type recombinase/integrase [Dehalococcoidia bacterium]
MRGHLKQRAKGSWTIWLELDRDPVTNRRRQKTLTVRGTKKQAEAKLAELEHQLNTGSFVPQGKLTVGQFLHQWLKDYAETNVRPTTFEGYRIIVDKHLIPSLGNKVLGQLQPLHLQHYYRQALDQGLSPQTVKHHHRVLCESLNHAVRWGLAGRNVTQAVDPPKVERNQMNALDDAGIQRLLDLTRGTIYYPVIHLAIFTGLRRSELLGLRWSDVDLNSETLTVNQVLHVLPGGRVIFQQPKTSRSKRTVTLSPTAVLTLKAYRESKEADMHLIGSTLSDTDLVFSNAERQPMLPNTITHAFAKISRKAGLNVRFHDLRHTHVSRLIKLGVDSKHIADRVGHSTISTTLDIYGHLFSESQREVAMKFELGLALDSVACEGVPLANG